MKIHSLEIPISSLSVRGRYPGTFEEFHHRLKQPRFISSALQSLPLRAALKPADSKRPVQVGDAGEDAYCIYFTICGRGTK
jgi:hypothetical protein